MPIYQTKQLLTKLQEQTDEFLNKAISEWRNIAPSKLLLQPGEKKWSAAQCLEHLNSYGRYYLPAIEKAIEAAKKQNQRATEEFKSGLLGAYFTKKMESIAGRQSKMKSPKDHQPLADLDTDKVISEFIDQQEKLLVLLEQAREIDLNKAKVPISIARFIRLKLGDVSNFLIAHNLRHVLQAERALKPVAENEAETTATTHLSVRGINV